MKKYGCNKPYVIAGWGPDGYWEVPKTSWGAPYEQTGREKLDCYELKYRKSIESRNCLGSCVFTCTTNRKPLTTGLACSTKKNGKHRFQN
ncbi:MAG TPA: hypothetical protein VLQ91_05110 [Draconibacterium sp.]|nr:hypothetical protein [Draconibacterium sp.]